jgi:hypothetical protein
MNALMDKLIGVGIQALRNKHAGPLTNLKVTSRSRGGLQLKQNSVTRNE